MAFVTVVMDQMNGLDHFISLVKPIRMLVLVQMFAWKWAKKKEKNGSDWLKSLKKEQNSGTK